MLNKKIIIPLILGIGIGSYLYFGGIGDKSKTNTTQKISLVEAEQINTDGSSRTLDVLKEKAQARDQDGNVVRLEDMSGEMKEITGRLRIMQDELSDYLETSIEEEKVFRGEDAELEAELAKLDIKLDKINAKEGIDGEAIKQEIIAMLDEPLRDDEMPVELAESLNKTDAMLLELEEEMDKIKEEM